MLIGGCEAEGVAVKVLNVGSTGGLAAAKRGECDLAPIHLMDPATGPYNRPFLTAGLELVPGYRRLQGIVFRKGDRRFEGRSAAEALAAALADPDCLMVNRNAGSGTRILTRPPAGAARRPPGYWSQPKSHNAVAVAVAQGRADWGVAIEGRAPIRPRVHPGTGRALRLRRAAGAAPAPAVQRFRAVLQDAATRAALSTWRPWGAQDLTMAQPS